MNRILRQYFAAVPGHVAAADAGGIIDPDGAASWLAKPRGRNYTGASPKASGDVAEWLKAAVC